MSLFFYSIILYLVQPIIVLRLFWRSLKNPIHRDRFIQRYGFVSNIPEGCLWIHAVSVGETIASEVMVKRLQQQYPELTLLITSTTTTGSAQVKKSFGDSVYQAYVPYDLPGSVARFIAKVKPLQCIIMETELWPNLINGCAKKNVPVVIANARLSEKSQRGYERFAAITKPMLQKISCVAVQTDIEKQRFTSLGLPSDRVEVCGSIKYDIALTDKVTSQAEQWREQWQVTDRPVWIAASTHKGEDEILLQAHQVLLAQFNNALLILVPRHPERFDSVYKLCQNTGLTVARRSNSETVTDGCQVLLADTMGELMALYGVGNVAFIGGSLVANGGHNMLEAAVWGLPILSGSSVFNFAEIAQGLVTAGAMEITANTKEIGAQLVTLFNDPAYAKQVGDAAARLQASNRGALDKLLTVVSHQLP
ncbi:MAG: lipid IV(A) 3-deoxy-D-manno-octulosonic acid transferase [Sinobacterium sp.]|jgi:3-deoxy-D-manno-octulosonic-acid transferase